MGLIENHHFLIFDTYPGVRIFSIENIRMRVPFMGYEIVAVSDSLQWKIAAMKIAEGAFFTEKEIDSLIQLVDPNTSKQECKNYLDQIYSIFLPSKVRPNGEINKLYLPDSRNAFAYSLCSRPAFNSVKMGLNNLFGLSL